MTDPDPELIRRSSEPGDAAAAVPALPAVAVLDLERQLAESTRYYVCGVIENATRFDPATRRQEPAPMRFADIFEAASPREAEDAARQEVRSMVHLGRHGNLWVAGVYQLNLDADGRLQDPPFLTVDTYAKYVDPDLTDEVL